MATVNFPEHFVFVTLATLALVCLDVVLPGWENALADVFSVAHFALYGAMHAVAVVLATKPFRTSRAIAVVILAAALSYGAHLLVLATMSTLELGAFALGSGVGALTYALLLGLLWLPHLKVLLVLVAVPFCASATMSVFLLPESVPLPSVGVLFTGVWWYAFSLSLWFASHLAANKSLKADAVNGAA